MDLSERPKGLFRRHPWEVSRSRFFRELVRHFVGQEKLVSVLDVGAGDGWLSGKLAEDCPQGTRIHCWDSRYSEEMIGLLSEERSEMFRFSAIRPPGRFSLILLLDVLEHVEDDRGFIKSLVSDSLEEHGCVIISVPACPSLFTGHDRALGHHRRYNPRDIRGLIRESGLSILRNGGLFHALLPFRLVAKLGEMIMGSGDVQATETLEWRHGESLGLLAEGLLRIDNAISLAFSGSPLALPGLSWFAVCQKR